MLSFTISGKTYELPSLDAVPMNVLMRLPKETGGLTLKGIEAGFKNMDPEDPDFFLIGVLVWISRTMAGERLSLEDACNFPLNELAINSDDDSTPEAGDEGEAADPTAAA
jgi:hypothetical protein